MPIDIRSPKLYQITHTGSNCVDDTKAQTDNVRVVKVEKRIPS
jgi:hypothetical protein